MTVNAIKNPPKNIASPPHHNNSWKIYITIIFLLHLDMWKWEITFLTLQLYIMFIYTTFVSSFEKYLDPKLTETAVTKANILKNS